MRRCSSKNFLVFSNLMTFALAFLIGLICSNCPRALAQSSPTEVLDAAEESVAIRQQTQGLRDQWVKEQTEMNRILDVLEMELRRISFRQKKADIYRHEIQKELTRLEEENHKIQALAEGLEPFLEETAQRLNAFVQADTPFRKDFRLLRLENLEKTLNDFDATLAQKTGRLFEALRREVEMGHVADTDEEEIQIEGRPTRVKTLQIGRLALLAQGLDGHQCWVYSPRRQSFTISPGYSRSVGQAIDIVDKSRLTELLDLPIGALTKGGRP